LIIFVFLTINTADVLKIKFTNSILHIDGNNYYVQPQSKEYGVLVLSEKQNRKIDESDFLNILGIKHLGIGLNYIINNFVDE